LQKPQDVSVSTPGMPSRWRKEYLAKKDNTFPGAGHQTPEASEIKRLREEIRKLRMEKEILKKATAFFAKESD